MKRVLLEGQRCLALRLPLRWRLTFWTAGLFLALGLGLVVFINGMTAIQIPRVLQVELVPTLTSHSFSDDSAFFSTSALEPRSPPLETPVSSATGVQAMIINQVRAISLIGIGLFALAGSAGAYWIATRSLRPVRYLSQLAQAIQAQTLHQRLPVEGPHDEVKELALAFNEMLARLEKAFEQQDRFVANAAHELRTPLTTLRTNLEVIHKDASATLDDYKETARILERALSRLEQLVEDLLLLARGEKELHLESVEMEVLLREMLQEIQPLAREHQVEMHLTISESVTVWVDMPLFARAISNLLQNGIRYNRPGGSITVTVCRLVNGIELRVEDTGIGIPEEAQPYIFERFFRVDRSRSRQQGGYGLGLSITAHIVQLHGGHIRVESTPGVGSTFVIWLPDTQQSAWLRT